MNTTNTVRLTAEETIYIANVLDNSTIKTRLAVINNMDLALSGSIISGEEKHFIKICVLKLQTMSDRDFNNINFFSVWALDDADEQDEEDL